MKIKKKGGGAWAFRENKALKRPNYRERRGIQRGGFQRKKSTKMPNSETEGEKRGGGGGELSAKCSKTPNTEREEKKKLKKKKESYEVPYEIGTSVKKELVQ